MSAQELLFPTLRLPARSPRWQQTTAADIEAPRVPKQSEVIHSSESKEETASLLLAGDVDVEGTAESQSTIFPRVALRIQAVWRGVHERRELAEKIWQAAGTRVQVTSLAIGAIRTNMCAKSRSRDMWQL